MTDISVFKKMLAPERCFTPLPRLKKVWVCARKLKEPRGNYRYFYWLWIGQPSPFQNLFTYSLKHAIDSAAELGETVIEHGPPEAFGRAPE